MLNTRFKEYSREEQLSYKKIAEQGVEMFGGKENISVFHKILIDRVANGYIHVQRWENDATATKKLENAQKRLQSWLKLIFGEITSTRRLEQEHQRFLEKCVDIIDDNISDDRMKKSIFKQLKGLTEEKL